MNPTLSNAMAVRWIVGGGVERLPQVLFRRAHTIPASRLFSSSSQISPQAKSATCHRVTPPSNSSIPSQSSFIASRNGFTGSRGVSNAAARKANLISVKVRQMSTIRPLSQAPISWRASNQPPRRSLFGSSNNNNLMILEETANRNPKSATAQNAFYQALLRANMHAIIVERYETNAFATNASCESAYHQALGAASQTKPTTPLTGQSNSLNATQLQAIGQAVAAQSRGANVGIAAAASSAGTGADKGAPLHVVVQESIGHQVFKWFKLLLYFGLTTYICMMLITLLIETVAPFKKAGGAGKSDSETRSENQTVRFSDVHGCDEAKEELQDLVEFLKNPEKFSTLGGKLPKGVLLVGPPGTGKTLLARAVAGEAGVPFFFMSGSEFDEVYVGVGAKRVRELFAAAKGKSPAIVFIDELDAVGGKRNTRDASYHRQTLNQLLTELDGFEQNSGVIILAATNFPELLDKALTRPGRFDRNVVVSLPDVRGRVEILRHHMKKIIAGKDVSLETLAQGTPGFSGAELENVINQAAVHASKAKAQAVSMIDFEWAKDKVMMGAEKKSMVISDKEKEMTAFHEAGHALVIMFSPRSDPLHKITILPRGGALGITFKLPAMDQYSMSMDQYEASIDVCLGGKVAEELIYGSPKVTSGCSSDLQSATQIAYMMVVRCGMSPLLGNVDLATNYDALSPNTKELVESEVRRIIEESRVRATNILKEHRTELDLLAKALIDYETLDKDEAFKVIKGEKLDKALVSSGGIKVPIPTLPPIPGSGDGGKEPPVGGAVA